MKEIITLILCFQLAGLYHQCNAQEFYYGIDKERVGISYSSWGQSEFVRFQSLDGDASYSAERFITYGIIYERALAGRWTFESGLTYGKYHTKISPSSNPGTPSLDFKYDFQIISLPITAKIYFLKYFFVQSGVFLGFSTACDQCADIQTGLGMSLGLGGKYTLGPLTAFASPYFQIHSMLPFISPITNYQRLFENGIRLGLLYNIRYKD